MALLAQQMKLTTGDRAELMARARAKLADWRGLLRRNVPQARQIISKLVDGRLSILPEFREGESGFRVTGSGCFVKFIEENPLFGACGERWCARQVPGLVGLAKFSGIAA
jgi:hypothetical protein